MSGRTAARLAIAVALAARALEARADPSVGAATPRASALALSRAEGAEACVGPRELARAVERRLGHEAFVSASQAELFIEARVERAAKGFHAHITLASAEGAVLGTRDLDDADPTCKALGDPLALVVALLLDPDALTRAPAPLAERPRASGVPRARSTALPPELVEPVVPVVPLASVVPAPPSLRGGFSLGASAAAGLLPKLSVAWVLRGEITPPGFMPIEVSGAIWIGEDAVANGGDAGAHVSLATGAVGLCPLAYRTTSMTVLGCADLFAGAFRATGYGFASSGAQESAIVGAEIAGRARRRIAGPFELGVSLGVMVPFVRPEVDGAASATSTVELFHVAAVGLDAGIFAGLSFP